MREITYRQALNEALEHLKNGKAGRSPQEASIATYAPKLAREDGRIDWTEPAALIERKIRAFNPWPGAFTLWRDAAGHEQKLKIFSGKVVESGKTAVGEILRSDGSITIAASDGMLLLGDVQIEGKRRMRAEEFLRGHPA